MGDLNAQLDDAETLIDSLYSSSVRTSEVASKVQKEALSIRLRQAESSKTDAEEQLARALTELEELRKREKERHEYTQDVEVSSMETTIKAMERADKLQAELETMVEDFDNLSTSNQDLFQKLVESKHTNAALNNELLDKNALLISKEKRVSQLELQVESIEQVVGTERDRIVLEADVKRLNSNIQVLSKNLRELQNVAQENKKLRENCQRMKSLLKKATKQRTLLDKISLELQQSGSSDTE